MKPLHRSPYVGHSAKPSALLLRVKRGVLPLLFTLLNRSLVVIGRSIEQAIVTFLGIVLGFALTIWVAISSIDVWFPLTVKALWTFLSALVRITRFLIN